MFGGGQRATSSNIELPAHWEINICNYIILEKFELRKNMYTWERGAGLGWVVAASFSVICPRTSLQLFQLLFNVQNSPLIDKLTHAITPSFRSME
jgi:hypothetical protein